MPARPFVCLACRRTLGTISRKRDHRGKPYDRLMLARGVRLGHILFRGDCAVCQCGHEQLFPSTVSVFERPTP